MNEAWSHPTAIVEEDVVLGPGTRIWDGVHVRRGARIGRCCIVGEKTYIAYDVTIGDYVKLNASVYVCAQVTIEDFCMISAHVVFTNDRFPRAGNMALTGLETSDPTSETLRTRVCRGVTVGANATVGPGVRLGEFAMIGMGAVVTKDVGAHALVTGNPARVAGWVCTCGVPLEAGGKRVGAALETGESDLCRRCGRRFTLTPSGVTPALDAEARQ